MLSKHEVLQRILKIANQKARDKLLEPTITKLKEKGSLINPSNIEILKQQWSPFWAVDLDKFFITNDALGLLIEQDQNLYNEAQDIIKESIVESFQDPDIVQTLLQNFFDRQSWALEQQT